MSKRSRFVLVAFVVAAVIAAVWIGGASLMQLLMKMHGH